VARPEVPDTGVFIQVMRQPRSWAAFQHALAAGRIWLSAIVVAELYAGTRSREDTRLLDRIAGAMWRIDRLLTPCADDWARAGRLIARAARLRGAVRPRDHLADVLILVSAARLRGTVVTANLRHFELWAVLATAAGLDVTVTPFVIPA
jgi:predicted nucleic acid-binding protein